MKHQPYEFVTSAGEGTMLTLGVADNLHSVKAYAARDELKQLASGGNQVDLHYAETTEACPTGK